MEVPIHETPAASTSTSASPRHYSPAPVLAKTTLSTLLVIGSLAVFLFIKSGAAFWPQHKLGDAVEESQQQERVKAFAALGAIPLAIVSEAELTGAVDSMGLTPDARQALQANLTSGGFTPRSVSDDEVPAAQKNTSIMQQEKVSQSSLASHAALKKHGPLQLAWITLWDTDAEDGDAIRIESEGYSRLVVLTKEPVTFAIPVPLSGVVNIHGVKDGEGGGITVGLASGASKAIFPIMSVGQVLGLKVKVL